MTFKEINKKIYESTTKNEYLYWLTIKDLFNEYGEEFGNRILLYDYAEGVLTPEGDYNEV